VPVVAPSASMVMLWAAGWACAVDAMAGAATAQVVATIPASTAARAPNAIDDLALAAEAGWPVVVWFWPVVVWFGPVVVWFGPVVAWFGRACVLVWLRVFISILPTVCLID
jgi:hypothetical protein